MRVIRVLLLLLPLALCLTAAASAEPISPAQPTQEQLLTSIFQSPERNPPPVGPMFQGYCAITCEPCVGPGDCPKVGTLRNRCAYACN